MTPEQRAQFDKLGRTGVLGTLKMEALPETTRRAAIEWISDDDRQRDRRDRRTLYAAIIAAIAAIIAAIAAIVSPMMK